MDILIIKKLNLQHIYFFYLDSNFNVVIFYFKNPVTDLSLHSHLISHSCFQDSSSHSNLGAMLHLSGKLTEAEASYRRALQLDPDDVTTLTNVHKLRHLLARLETWRRRACPNMTNFHTDHVVIT